MGRTAQTVTARPPACTPDPQTTRWIGRAVAGWETVSRDALKLPPSPAPWMVFYDAACAWHIGFDRSRLEQQSVLAPVTFSWNGAPLELRAVAHGGQVRLPDGSEWPARENTARASFYRGTEATFFVVATPEAWRRDAGLAADPLVDEFFLGVAMHELTHTRHLPVVAARVKDVAARHGLSTVTLDDDVIQDTFGGDTRVRSEFEAERDLFFAAAAESAPDTRRALIRKGLERARARRARYFAGDKSHYRELEDIFLSLEGAGQWASYALARHSRSAVDAVAFVRDTKRYWSQEEGLALFLLLDVEVPGWQRTVFGPDDIGPLAMLEQVLTARQ
jgi:hypothetical protein